MRLVAALGALLLLWFPQAPVHSLPRGAGPSTATVVHPRLYFSSADLPHLRAKIGSSPFMAGTLRQYSDALNHKLNYSAGGVLVDVGADPAKNISDNEGRGTRHELAASLFVMGSENASAWGQLARTLVYEEATGQFDVNGSAGTGCGWFAGPQRELEQMIASYDAVHSLFTPAEAAEIEAAFGRVAQCLHATKPAAWDMASRAMNPAADRLGVLGLIALTLPSQ